jgi:tRNA A37 threonylcarbamoyladenosine biosynthesis protein TsaE
VLHHLDLYRLESHEAILRAGLEPYLLEPVGVSVVEWAERWFEGLGGYGRMPRQLRRVWIEVVGTSERSIRYGDTCA